MISATVTVKNECSSFIVFTSVGQVNDDAEWSVSPAVSTKLQPGQTMTIGMGNESAPFPKGVGFSSQFIDSQYEVGSLGFDDPAVGAHSFSSGGPFNFAITNPSNNNYVVVITNKG